MPAALGGGVGAGSHRALTARKCGSRPSKSPLSSMSHCSKSPSTSQTPPTPCFTTEALPRPQRGPAGREGPRSDSVLHTGL